MERERMRKKSFYNSIVYLLLCFPCGIVLWIHTKQGSEACEWWAEWIDPKPIKHIENKTKHAFMKFSSVTCEGKQIFVIYFCYIFDLIDKIFLLNLFPGDKGYSRKEVSDVHVLNIR